MSNALDQYLIYGREIWRRRWLVVASTLIVCAIGWPVVHMLPNKYSVSAKINVDTQSVLKPLLKGLAVDSDFTQETALVIQRTLLTRPNLEKIVRTVDLDLGAKASGDLERILFDLRSKINISVATSGRKSNPAQQSQTIYTISYVDREPTRAKKVVEEVLNLFIESVLSATRKDSELTQEFLTNEIKEYELKLEKAENRLKDFKRENVGLIPTANSNYFSQLSNETSDLNNAKLELDEALRRRDAITEQIKEVVDSQHSSDSAQNSQILTPLDERIRSMQVRLDELLLQFTEEHPDVISLRRMLEELKKQKEKERAVEPHSTGETRLLNNNPVYQELRVSLGEVKAEVAALTARVNLYQSNVDRLKQQIDTMPRVEAELAKLNRDYNVIHDRYLELVKRREAARISFEAGSNPEEAQFKVIDPPRVPLGPSWPDRPLFLTVVLGAGLGLGVGLVILLMQLKPTYQDWHSLSNNTGLPVFGTVSLVMSAKEITKERVSLTLFGIVTIVLLAIYFALVAMQLLNINFGEISNTL